jgi:cardiolipin synthase
MSSDRWRWIPNALTLLRILLIIPFAMTLLEGQYRLALGVFALAAVSDGFDGFLARRFDWRTRLGAIADPLADKALLVTAYLVLVITNVLPVWLFIVVLGRDLVIIAGGLLYHFYVGRYDMQPSLPGKFNTLVQILVVLAIIILSAGLPMPEWVLPAGIWLVTASTLLSGLHYVIVWTGRAWQLKRE